MSATLRASAAGLEQVDRARKRKNWNKTEQAWCDQALTSVPTLKRFWLRKAIQRVAFQGICQVVGIEDWESIVDDRSTESLLTSDVPIAYSTYDQTTWVGREALIQALTEKLQNQCRVLLLTGLTGIGKTALAERLATENTAGRFIYCTLSFDEVQEQSFVAGGRRLLEEKLKLPLPKQEFNDATAIRQRLSQALKEKPYWLQLDSLEALLIEDEQGGNRFAEPTWLSFFHQLLSADCLSYCVLTSQDLPGDLKALGSRYPKIWHCQTLLGLTTVEQCALFRQQGIAPADTENLTCLERISKAYEGHPLVLQVIAAEILTEFQGDIQAYWQRYQTEIEQIDRQVQLRSHNSPTIRSRELQHIVRHRVRQAWERLPAAARQMLCASSVYRRSVPVTFWLAMVDTAGEVAFETLQDRYLVEWEGNLIRAHNLIGSVAADLLKADRVAWHKAERTAADCWQTYTPDANATNLELVRGVLEAFYHYCAVEDWQAATEIVLVRSPNCQYPLHRQLGIWGYYAESIQIYSQLLHRTTLQTDVICLNGIELAHINLSHYDEASAYLQQSLNLARELGDRAIEATALNGLSLVHSRLSNYAQMVELLQQSLPIAVEIGDRELEGQALLYLGIAAIALSHQSAAIEYFQRALDIAQEIGDRYGEAAAMFRIGSAYCSGDNHLQAIEYFQQALNIAQEIGDRYGEGLALRGLGNAYYFLSNYAEAMEHYQQNLAIAQTLGSLHEVGNAWGSLGNVCSALGDYQQAVEYHQQHLSSARAIGARLGEAHALGNLSDAYHHLGCFTEALNYLQQTLHLCKAINSRRGEAITMGNLGKVYVALGELTQALNCNQQSLEISREVNDQQNEAVVLGNLGTAYAALNDYTQAFALHQQQLALSRKIGDRRSESRALLGLGKVSMALKQYPEARDALQTSLQLCQTIGDRPTQAEVLQQLAQLQNIKNLHVPES